MEAPVIAPSSGVYSSLIRIHSQRAPQFIDITDVLLHHVRMSGVAQGLAVVTSRHTTAAIVVNEHEPELLKDLSHMLDTVAPRHQTYAHNAVPCDVGEQPNGHAHCQALLLCASANVPVINGVLALGRWQRIFLVELDCSRQREVTVMILGSTEESR